LYIMSNETCKIKSLMNNYKCHSINDLNPMVMIDRINDTVNKLDKFNFINDYVKSKGATPLFVVVVNRGVRLDKKSPEEKELLSNQNVYIEQRREWLKDNNPPEYIKGLYKDEEKDKIKDLYSYKAPIIKATKVISSDFSNSLVTVSNGLRRTKYQPKNYNRKVLFFGSSTTFSSGVSDQDTLVSQIQKKINASLSDIKVENHGVLGANSLLSINNLVQTKINPNDVVVFFDFDEFKDLDSENIKVVNLNEIDRGNDFFIDLTEHQCHYSPNGNKKLAEEIATKFLLPVIKDRNVNLSSYTNLDDRVFSVLDNFKYFLYKQTAQLCESGEMKEYLNLLDRYKPLSGLKVGSIAVNCNPITNGHMHLIKYASEQVDKLYVFVIEEDQSFFKFKDRFRLVSESTKHIENITVLPGGKFICTELTYPTLYK
ncbi:citrate lyase ligase, partial [Photobacterium chitinilyticum]|uniref:citrate lyase ligase n=1 Tax=Photobacterium chitinilyticum TaxID=2485123 RepID=UPI003D0EE006